MNKIIILIPILGATFLWGCSQPVEDKTESVVVSRLEAEGGGGIATSVDIPTEAGTPSTDNQDADLAASEASADAGMEAGQDANDALNAQHTACCQDCQYLATICLRDCYAEAGTNDMWCGNTCNTPEVACVAACGGC